MDTVREAHRDLLVESSFLIVASKCRYDKVKQREHRIIGFHLLVGVPRGT